MGVHQVFAGEPVCGLAGVAGEMRTPELMYAVVQAAHFGVVNVFECNGGDFSYLHLSYLLVSLVV